MNSDATQTHNTHALVVGGSGMLRRASLYLAEQGYTVSVIGRRPERFQLLVEAASTFRGEIIPLPLDYRDDEQLQTALEESIAQHGPITLAVCWIHSTAPDALRIVGTTLATHTNSCRLFHVRGSAVANPANPRSQPPTWLLEHPQIHYRQVILGFVVNGGNSRWLTHEEISGGVITAIETDDAYHIVGTVEPWSLRP